jgi:hypothetical protein
MSTLEHTEHQPATSRQDANGPSVWAYLRKQGGQWHATAVDYSIVGSGATQEEALRKMREMVDDYLESCAHEGISEEDARRPIPPRWTLSLMGNLLTEVARLALRREGRQGRVYVPRHC